MKEKRYTSSWIGRLGSLAILARAPKCVLDKDWKEHLCVGGGQGTLHIYLQVALLLPPRSFTPGSLGLQCFIIVPPSPLTFPSSLIHAWAPHLST
eukprot:1156818-Pelagomonas_calceolata.AAC.3